MLLRASLLASLVVLVAAQVKYDPYYLTYSNNEAIVRKAEAELIALQQQMALQQPQQLAAPVAPVPQTRAIEAPAPAAAAAMVKKADEPKKPLTRALTNRGKFEAKDFVGELKNGPVRSTGLGGTLQPMGLNELPSLDGLGISYTLFNLDPCGINLPHVHPRATEMIYVLRGVDLRTGFTEENDGRTIVNDIKAGQVTFFPQGLIHYQQNLGCEPVEFLSALNNEDPGTVTVGSRVFTLPTEALQATFAISAEQVEEIKKGLPAGPARGRAECLKKCGLNEEGKPLK